MDASAARSNQLDDVSRAVIDVSPGGIRPCWRDWCHDPRRAAPGRGIARLSRWTNRDVSAGKVTDLEGIDRQWRVGRWSTGSYTGRSSDLEPVPVRSRSRPREAADRAAVGSEGHPSRVGLAGRLPRLAASRFDTAPNRFRRPHPGPGRRGNRCRCWVEAACRPERHRPLSREKRCGVRSAPSARRSKRTRFLPIRAPNCCGPGTTWCCLRYGSR